MSSMRRVALSRQACCDTPSGPQLNRGECGSCMLRTPPPEPRDPAELALGALAWLLGDSLRAQRFLDLTGLTPEALRASIDACGTQAAVLDFLCAHEPDLESAAEALGVVPEELAGARRRLPC